jgi:hypothetical protein
MVSIANVPDRYLQLKLITLGEQLAAALKAQEWDSVGGIDQRIRECLQELANTENPSPELQQAKSQLQQLYARVIPAYAEACEKLRQLLVNHRDFSEGRSAYLRTGLLQGEK